MDCYRDEGIKLVKEYPPATPELNIIENCWYMMEKQVRMRSYKTMIEFKSVIEEEWQKLDMNYIRILINSLKRRAKELIKVNGYNCKY